MSRPSTLIHEEDDEDQPEFSAPATNINKEAIDCGLSCFGGVTCCNGRCCQRMATPCCFVTILLLAGLLQGGVQEYFRYTAQIAAEEFDYNPDIIDWLLVASHLVMGALALLVAYWGNYFHRASWLGALVILQAIASFVVIIPKLTHTHGPTHEEHRAIIMHTPLSSTPLCRPHENLMAEAGEFCFSTLVMLFILQAAIGLGNIAFFCFGLSYIDDNVREHHSPALIGVAIASRIWGAQLGSIMTWAISTSPVSWWVGWPPIAGALLFMGLFIALFPLRLVTAAVRQAAANILDEATSNNNGRHQHRGKFLADPGFCRTLGRLLTNKILLLNSFALVFLLAGLFNFALLEPAFLQAKFYLPVDNRYGFSDPWISRFITSALKPPLVALCVVISGLIITACKPRATCLVAWNVGTSIVIVLLLIGGLFFNCSGGDIKGTHKNRLLPQLCSAHCKCPSDTPFMPVCVENKIDTYFSPCDAGCTSEMIVNDEIIFSNCACSVRKLPDEGILPMLFDTYNASATVGACDAENCEMQWAIFQILGVIGYALLGTGLVGSFFITLRSVLPQDKAMAIGLKLCLIGVLVYVPGKLGYDAIRETTCQLRHNGSCRLHNGDQFGTLLLWITAALVLLSILFNFLVLVSVRKLGLYGGTEEGLGIAHSRGSYREIEMTDPSSASPAKRAATGTGVQSSLLEDAPFPDIDQTPTSPPAGDATNNRNGTATQRGGSTPSTAEMVVVQTTAAALATPDEPELNFEPRKPSPTPPRSLKPLNSDL